MFNWRLKSSGKVKSRTLVSYVFAYLYKLFFWGRRLKCVSFKLDTNIKSCLDDVLFTNSGDYCYKIWPCRKHNFVWKDIFRLCSLFRCRRSCRMFTAMFSDEAVLVNWKKTMEVFNLENMKMLVSIDSYGESCFFKVDCNIRLPSTPIYSISSLFRFPYQFCVHLLSPLYFTTWPSLLILLASIMLHATNIWCEVKQYRYSETQAVRSSNTLRWKWNCHNTMTVTWVFTAVKICTAWH
jgi:hypothetical protein